MISRRKQWMQLLLVTIIACLCFSCTPSVSASTNDVINKLYKQSGETKQIRTLIRNYCDVVLNSPGFVQNNFPYNAQQSAFVHLICKNIGYSSSYFKNNEDKYFKRTEFKQLGFQTIVTDSDGYTTDLCAPGSMDNGCDLSRNMPKLLNSIINDYINMKQSSLYGLITNYTGEKDLEKNVVNPYSQAYFDIDICNTEDPHNYPKTCRMVKGYVQDVRNILSDVSIFNPTGILALSTEKADTDCATITGTTDIFYCGLYGDTQGASMMSFVNLVYNELFYYRLFMGYYMIMIQRYPGLAPMGYSTISRDFSTEYTWTKDALSLSLRMMRDTYMAFPFHVGFSMYQEDLDGFGKSLANIAPPIYTLYDKLRNVQKPE